MELIVINENKIKIILDPSDMQKYGLRNDSCPSSREILKSIFCEAGLKKDFEGTRFFIQMYPEKHGGCEMFVTKLNIDSKESLPMPQYNEQSVIPIKTTRKPLPKKSVITYAFYKLEWLLCACRELKKRNFLGESAVYRDVDGIYYLVLTLALTESEKTDTFRSFLSELGESESTEYTNLYISENGKCICENNAIATLSIL